MASAFAMLRPVRVSASTWTSKLFAPPPLSAAAGACTGREAINWRKPWSLTNDALAPLTGAPSGRLQR